MAVSTDQLDEERLRAEMAALETATTLQHTLRRHGSVTTTTDGMTRAYAEWATVDGAIFAAATQAFRRPDRPGEHRSPEQATADAMIAMTRAALDGTGPASEHGQRPHVVITVPIQTLIDHAGPVDLDGSAVPLDAIRHLLDDAGYSFILTDQHDLPVAVTTEARTVPPGWVVGEG